MIYITLREKLKPRTADAYLAASKGFTDATRAEPGNMFYEHYRSVDDPDTILTIEAFDDAAADRSARQLAALPAGGRRRREAVIRRASRHPVHRRPGPRRLGQDVRVLSPNSLTVAR